MEIKNKKCILNRTCKNLVVTSRHDHTDLTFWDGTPHTTHHTPHTTHNTPHTTPAFQHHSSLLSTCIAAFYCKDKHASFLPAHLMHLLHFNTRTFLPTTTWVPPITALRDGTQPLCSTTNKRPRTKGSRTHFYQH